MPTQIAILCQIFKERFHKKKKVHTMRCFDPFKTSAYLTPSMSTDLFEFVLREIISKTGAPL